MTYYKIETDIETNTQEIVQCNLDETNAEDMAIKEMLQSQLEQYEKFEITYIDRYYHVNRIENTYSLELSNSVFKDNKFIGYFIKGKLCVIGDGFVEEVKEVKGATSFEVMSNIRKK